ncbi:transcription factor TAF7p/TAFII55 [Cryptosporidium ryanae]|uniref:transcription factor TAF7p/TAFII55 n=1 Tax=Cryptosporidium ryanae TaxID=515981 RepID=UPI003519F1DD|nr:transcription factor TAF7p/TAFII55 [Cryptosporidium ryanae]
MGQNKCENNTEAQFEPQRYLRRGVFSSVDLYASAFSDVPESVCVIRFPEHAAEELGELLQKGKGFPLGIHPTPFEDFRIFDVHILGRDYVGILVDLPCNVEVYKSLDCENLFKSTNLSQMLYIYDARNLPNSFIVYSGVNPNEVYYGQLKSSTAYLDPCFVSFISYLKDVLNWEWPSGLLPASRNIRSRKYRSTELFDINEVIEAEQEILDRVSMPNQDMFVIEMVPKSQMDQQIDLFNNEDQENSPFPTDSFYNRAKKATCMGVIGKDDNLRDMIGGFEVEDLSESDGEYCYFEFDEIQSDISDAIFRESLDGEDLKLSTDDNVSVDDSQTSYEDRNYDQFNSDSRPFIQEQLYAQMQTENADEFAFQDNDQYPFIEELDSSNSPYSEV